MALISDLLDFAVFTAIALLWARWSKLDLGLRAPALREAGPWVLLFIAWVAAEWAIAAVHPSDGDRGYAEQMVQRSLPELLLSMVVLGPLWEELLFRGAMFSALLRRWGIWAAAVVSGILWSLIHTDYEWWVVASFAGSGVVLAMIRWKSGSLYPPLVLHAAANLLVALYYHDLLGLD